MAKDRRRAEPTVWEWRASTADPLDPHGVPNVDALDHLGAILAAPTEDQDQEQDAILSGLPLVHGVRQALLDPPRDPWCEVGFSSDRLVSDLCEDEGYQIAGRPTAKGFDLLSPEPDRRRRAAQELVAR